MEKVGVVLAFFGGEAGSVVQGIGSDISESAVQATGEVEARDDRDIGCKDLVEGVLGDADEVVGCELVEEESDLVLFFWGQKVVPETEVFVGIQRCFFGGTGSGEGGGEGGLEHGVFPWGKWGWCYWTECVYGV